MNILIVGFGNAGSGIAADLAHKGHTISVLKTSHTMHFDHFKKVSKLRRITLVENGHPSVVSLRNVTDDPKKAFDIYPDVVVVTTQSLQHEAVFRLLNTYLRPGTVVLLEPGNGGSLLWQKLPACAQLVIAEATSTPVDVRITTPGVVHVLFRNIRNPLGVFPLQASDHVLQVLRKLYSNFYLLGNSLIAALHNPNLIVHTIGTLLNVPRIEYSKGEFWMYKEGFTPAAWKVIDSLDNEKMGVVKRLGGEPTSYLEMAKIRNASNLRINARAMFDKYCQTGSPKGPDNIQTRYIYEDVPKGLVLLESLGALVGVPTPTASMLVQLAETITGKDFRSSGSTLLNLGINGMTRAKLMRFLKTALKQ